jgi:predicted PurR-regulated permease PerM
VPVAFVAGQLTVETSRAVQTVQEQTATGRWRETAARIPYVGETVSHLDPVQLEEQARAAAAQVAGRTVGAAGGAADAVVQGLVAVFVLFFCFRDREYFAGEIRKLLPLDPAAGDRVIGRAGDAVHATVYGTLLTSVLQGVTGGLMFWAVGLPAPVLWGAVMIVLGALPFVGAFLVWVPAVVFLATENRWGPAAAITAWGLVMAGPVCNYLYAWTAGDRMRMHPVPTLIAFIGGLAVFGVSGMVLGPCVLAVTAALLDVWRHRAADGIPVAAHTSVGTNSKEDNHGHDHRYIAPAPPA